MKSAEVADIWRRLRSAKSRQLIGLQLAWHGIPRLSDGCLSATKPFDVICGENGAGKSTILRRLFHTLVPEDRRPEASVYSGAEEGHVEYVRVELGYGSGVVPQTLVSVDAIREYFAPEGDALRVAFFDPAMHVPAIVNAINKDANFAEVLEPFEPKELGSEAVAEVSYIAGRDYDRVLIYEVDGVPSLGVFPYFQVQVSGVSYTSETMGFGELTLLLGYWVLSRMQPGSLVIMEEPETFVSPRSQRRFADLSAKFSLQNNLKIVATSHSPSIVSRFSGDELTLVSRAGHIVSIHSPAPRTALESRLELINRPNEIWFVEDAVAARVAVFLAAEVPAQVDVFIAGDNDAVISCATALKPYGRSDIRVIGLLDGDERRRRDLVPANVGFLPSDLSPDAFILDLLSTGSRQDMAAVLGVSAASLELAMGSVAGLDRHEVLHTLRRELEVSLDHLVFCALRWWALHRHGEKLSSIAELSRLG